MYDSPSSLVDQCLDTICNKLDQVFEAYHDPHEGHSYEITLGTYSVWKYRFKDSDMFLFPSLSERLLYKLGINNKLQDATLSLFTEKHTRLKTVRIRNARKITFEGLKILRQHKIIDLECIDLRNICISKILGEFLIINTSFLGLQGKLT